MNGAELIAAERRRQIEEEGWTPEHDAEHEDGELAIAAACYATPENERLYLYNGDVPSDWPWAHEWWKPCPGPDNRVRELVKAGALVAAEIDRLLARDAEESGDDPAGADL